MIIRASVAAGRAKSTLPFAGVFGEHEAAVEGTVSALRDARDPVLLPKLMGLAAGAAAAPWILFFVLRWILLRGFRAA
jgi:hypothetical protein